MNEPCSDRRVAAGEFSPAFQSRVKRDNASERRVSDDCPGPGYFNRRYATNLIVMLLFPALKGRAKLSATLRVETFSRTLWVNFADPF